MDDCQTGDLAVGDWVRVSRSELIWIDYNITGALLAKDLGKVLAIYADEHDDEVLVSLIREDMTLYPVRINMSDLWPTEPTQDEILLWIAASLGS